jgi:hypothetical protein
MSSKTGDKKSQLKTKDKAKGATEATPTREKKKDGKTKEGTDSKQPSSIKRGVAAAAVKAEDKKPSARDKSKSVDKEETKNKKKKAVGGGKDGSSSKGNKKESEEQMVGGPQFSGFKIAE